ncbi:MAG: hypothetical protein ABSB74_03325 [Tepidisphaeraceae bacterium]
MNRKLKNLLMPLVLATLAVGGLSGCVVREEAPPPTVAVAPTPPPEAPPPAPVVQEAPVVQDAPPPEVVEVQPVMPGPGYIWIGGFYRWEYGRYVWHRGYWGRPPYGYHRWYGGHWEHRPHGYFYVGGRWG